MSDVEDEAPRLEAPYTASKAATEICVTVDEHIIYNDGGAAEAASTRTANSSGSDGGMVAPLAAEELDLDQVNDNLQDYADDNLSLEVNFGDGSSCRASDVSSLSFQNIVLDDPENSDNLEIAFRSRRDSISESSDSPLNDYLAEDDQEMFSGRLEEELIRRESLHGGCLKNNMEDDMDQEENDFDTDSTNTGTMKRRNKLAAAAAAAAAAASCTNPTNPHPELCDGGGCISASSVQHSSVSSCYTGPFQERKSQEEVNSTAHSENDGDDNATTAEVSSTDGANQASLVYSDVVMREKSPNRSRAGSASSGEQSTKRNSLEVRNNIPNVGEVKNYDNELGFDRTKYHAQGAMPKMKKKSPGLARRLGDDDTPSVCDLDRDTSSSEKEMLDPAAPPCIDTSVHSAQKELENQYGSAPPYTPRPKPQSAGHSTGSSDSPGGGGPDSSSANSVEMLSDKSTSKDTSSSADELPKEHDNDSTSPDLKAEPLKNVDIENEYDYVKYARIQQGDSYVGMRLAYSSSNDSLNLKRSWSGVRSSDDEHCFGSSHEGSPEKTVINNHQQSVSQFQEQIRAVMSKVNEETLTEIPLNGSDHQQHACDDDDDRRNFSLSPEATECDSAEVESVLSDEGKSSTSGMPMVEDGLSSSQASDVEDAAQDLQRPSEILKRRHRVEIQQELHLKEAAAASSRGGGVNGPEDDGRSSSMTTENSSSQQSTPSRDDYKRTKRDEVDLAIHDIQTAIQRSKSVTLKSPTYPSGGDPPKEEPVWVLSQEVVDGDDDSPARENYAHKLSQQEELRRVQEQVEKHQQEAYRNRDPDQVYQGDEEDGEMMKYQFARSEGKGYPTTKEYDTDEETDELLDKQYTRTEKVDIPELSRPPVNRSAQAEKRRSRAREVTLRDPDNETVLIEGVLFRARYLGSTTLITDGQPSKGMRMMQAQEAVGRIKAPEGENQPSTEVDLFVSIEKIMVLNTDLQEIMMDHALRTISYIADIGEILVVMARRGPVTSPTADGLPRRHRQTKVCCHVFETDEAQLIAQSIGQAFQVAYMEFLKANGIDDPTLMKEIDYQEVLNQQEIFGEELYLFSNKEMQKEVIVPKLKTEALGVVIVESGWGSMVPTVVLANMSPTGAASRCGQLNIGDQIMSINGVSLVGLPLSSCQNYIKATRNQTVVKLTVVSCPPVVEVCIKRPDVKYQLGFSVQNGVICSLLRGGIAERGGVRVGHRIIDINGTSVVAVPHEKIVNMLATSVGEIHMKTMPTSIFRLLTGQETPHYI